MPIAMRDNIFLQINDDPLYIHFMCQDCQTPHNTSHPPFIYGESAKMGLLEPIKKVHKVSVIYDQGPNMTETY
jgi:hypothetical protein